MNTLAYLCPMRLYHAVFRFYVGGSIHVAAALLAMLCYTERVSGVTVQPEYFGALFFGSIAGYNCLKFGAEPWKYRPKKGSRFRLLFALSLVSLLVGLYFLILLDMRYWWMSAACASLAALYSLPLFPGFRNLRSFGLLKVPLVALVWVAATVWIPVWGSGMALGWDLWVESGQRFLWVGLLMLPFEIRDMDSDPPAIRTLPRRLGIEGTRRLGWIGAFLLLVTVALKDMPGAAEWASKGLAAVLTGLAIHFSNKDQPPFYASFWVEGIPMVCLVVLVAWNQLAGS